MLRLIYVIVSFLGDLHCMCMMCAVSRTRGGLSAIEIIEFRERALCVMPRESLIQFQL